MNRLHTDLPRLDPGVRLRVGEVPDGFEPLVLADLLRMHRAEGEVTPLLVIARDAQRMRFLEETLAFFAPEARIGHIPAWDCLPYDRVSPNPTAAADRVAGLFNLLHGEMPHIVLASVNAVTQRVMTPETLRARSFALAAGAVHKPDDIVRWLEQHGFSRDSTVREAGQYAVRGGILDLFPPGGAEPIRLDFFGDTLETIRPFDPETQRSTGQLRQLDLVPSSEITLDETAITNFRKAYVRTFGVPGGDDPLYEAVSEGRRFHGMEHWLPLFGDPLGSVLDYLPGAPVIFEPLAAEARAERWAQVVDHHAARRDAEALEGHGAPPYKPLPSDALYLDDDAFTSVVGGRATVTLSPFADASVAESGVHSVALGASTGRSFAAERARAGENVFDAVASHAKTLKATGKRVLFAAWSDGSLDRLSTMLSDHGLADPKPVPDFASASGLSKDAIGIAVLPLETGIETPDLAIIAEQDILGDRMVRPNRRKSGKDVLSDVTSLATGDLVVHVDHGIGRFIGLQTIDVTGAPHDCLELHYAGGDKLFLPVENIELLSRFGSEGSEVPLDRLGGGAWQARKAKLKQRIRDMAAELIKIAAARTLQSAPVLTPPEGLYDEFAARFPYVETEDQLTAIEAVMDDLASGQPMDRLVCGDVGFGKTEIALRAAFIVAMTGRQVAVVVPTTLLSRQHFKTFQERFRGLPLRIEQASRMVPAKDLTETKKGITSGDVDIVVGTHALLGKGIAFRDLGLLIIDEEQRFGVKHKERLKALRNTVHVLTLTATPIPRTLQLALTGVRELSVIATPPVDRLAVRTFVSPFDPVVVREAILREHYRGGQTFYVCPRISDIAGAMEFLSQSVPEVKVAVAHGQMAPTDLEDVMNAFYDGQFDVLLSTTIVESGLDIPTANTLIIHRADKFGLAQLYQLRGRVGRSKQRAYALFTYPADRKLTGTAERRLRVLQSLDGLGAGFNLASHDMDIRGAGNLLGEEQSGHIKEVGYELYQQMLEEAVAQLKDGGEGLDDNQWSPQINIAAAILIPEGYVGDLSLRMGLYKRLSGLESDGEIEGFAAELIDRFGPLPGEVEQLLQVMRIKLLCRTAGVEKVDTGPKGAVLAFRNNSFANPHGLVDYISKQGSMVKVRPDHKLVLMRDWPEPVDRLKGTRLILRDLARMAEMVAEAA
ncbi:MAG: transcription-repair coupling factor [Pseudomonadota bacterium]